jgi:hypothetical protein
MWVDAKVYVETHVPVWISCMSQRGVGRPSMASFYASSPTEVTAPVPPPVAADADSDSDWTPDNQ